MDIFLIILGIVVFVAVIFFVIAYICFRIAFYVPDRDPEDYEMSGIPEGEIYEPFREAMENWTKEAKAMKQEEFS